MFTERQHELFRQGYTAYQNLTDYIHKNGSLAPAVDETASDLQMQLILAKLGGADKKRLSDEQQMYIRSLITNTNRLRERVPGYGPFFLQMDATTWNALPNAVRARADVLPVGLEIALRRAGKGAEGKAGAGAAAGSLDTGEIDRVLTWLMLVIHSFVWLTEPDNGSEKREAAAYYQSIADTLKARQVTVGTETSELLTQSITAFDKENKVDEKNDLETILTHQEGAERSLDELTDVISQTMDVIRKGTQEGSSLPGHTQKKLSDLVGDLFGENLPDTQPHAVSETGKDTAKSQEETGEAPEEAAPAFDPTAEGAEERIAQILAELNAYIGLTTVKEEVNSLINVQKVNIRRKQAGLKEADVSKHLVFSGNPGTGKTTVARVLAKVYHELGILKEGQLIEVDRSGLVAGYIGQTAIKTSEVIEKAMGGILFIDEAYTLSNVKGQGDYGQEAIDTILKAMEDHRDDFVVIVAGYTELMEEFLDSNPGLRSRFNKFIHFPDYTVQELTDIFAFTAKKNGYVPTEEALAWVKDYYTVKTALSEPNFANARDVRNLFEDAVTRQANRLAAQKDISKEELERLTKEDLSGEAEEDPKAAEKPENTGIKETTEAGDAVQEAEGAEAKV